MHICWSRVLLVQQNGIHCTQCTQQSSDTGTHHAHLVRMHLFLLTIQRSRADGEGDPEGPVHCFCGYGDEKASLSSQAGRSASPLGSDAACFCGCRTRSERSVSCRRLARLRCRMRRSTASFSSAPAPGHGLAVDHA
jgi:hypothetical protein